MVIEDYQVYISGIPEEPKKRWKDFIDDARIYSYALSPEEDKMLYEGKEPPKILEKTFKRFEVLNR